MSRSKSVVVEKVRVLEKARDQGQLGKVSERWTVEDWLEHWLENIARPFVKQNTYEGYRAAVRKHLIPGLGRHRLDALKPEHLERLYVAMLKLPTRRGTLMSPGRVHQVHRTLRAALNEAVRRGYITRNPAELAKTPTVDDHEVEPYTVAEVQLLFTAASQERNGTRWVVALALGLRQGEALGLKWEDVDWQRALLTIKRSRVRPRWAHGCGGSCGHKYGGHCPQRQALRPDADTTKSKAGQAVRPAPGGHPRPAAGTRRRSGASSAQTAAPAVAGPGLDLRHRDSASRSTHGPTGTRGRSCWRGRRARRPAARRAAHRRHRAPAARGARATIMSVLGWSTRRW